MHIAYISDQRCPRAGTDTAQLVNMCAAFGTAGAKVTLFYLADDVDQVASAEQIADYFEVAPSFDTVPIKSRGKPIRGLEKIALARDAARCVTQRRVDLLYSRNLPSVMAGLWTTRLPVFYETYRPWPAQHRHKALLFRALRPQARLRGLILHSKLAADSYLDLGYAPERVLVAHNGYNPTVMGTALSRREARQRLGLPHQFTVTYSGTMMPSKGLGLVLDMAERLPEVSFVLVGSKSRGPIERRAEGLANVRVYGWLTPSEVSPYIYASDLVVVPPTAAPLERVGNTVLPIKVFFYLAAGRPVLAGDTPDIAEVIEHGRNGVIVPPGDVPAAVAAIRRLMASPAQWERLRQNALADGSTRTYAARAERILSFLDSRMG